jgi:hypothetical protein
MEILNYINLERVKPDVKEYYDVVNPATGPVITQTPLSAKSGCGAPAKGME